MKLQLMNSRKNSQKVFVILNTLCIKIFFFFSLLTAEGYYGCYNPVSNAEPYDFEEFNESDEISKGHYLYFDNRHHIHRSHMQYRISNADAKIASNYFDHRLFKPAPFTQREVCLFEK